MPIRRTRHVWTQVQRYGKLSVPSVRRSYATQISTSPEFYDVVCVGGGPAGLSLLDALRKLSEWQQSKTTLLLTGHGQEPQE